MNNKKTLFDGLIVYCAVVENEGFTAAARALGHTPSHVSKEIARLEERLGARLLNRTTRTVSLTDVGGNYYQKARQIIEDASSAEKQILDTSHKPSGLLKLSVPVSVALSCLNAWLPEFLDAYPDIRMSIDASDRLVDIVAEGFDVVVRAGQLKDSDLVARKLVTSRLMTVASPRYLATAGTPETPDELQGHVLIDYSLREISDLWGFSGHQGQLVNVPVVPRITCNSAETEQALAIAGVGITRLPGFSCQDKILSGDLVAILEDYEMPPIGLYAIYPSRSQLATKVRAFVDFLTRKFNS